MYINRIWLELIHLILNSYYQTLFYRIYKLLFYFSRILLFYLIKLILFSLDFFLYLNDLFIIVSDKIV